MSGNDDAPVTWRTLIMISSALAIGVPLLCTALFWVFGYFESAEHARIRDLKQSIEIEGIRAVIARNRVNECDIKVAEKTLTAAEKPACTQYSDELKESQRRIRDLNRKLEGVN